MKKIIFDHDLGSDCDDGGAGAILAKAHRDGLVRVLAVTHAIANPYGQYCMEAIFEYLGAEGVPFGYNLENDKCREDDCHMSTKGPAERYYARVGRPFPERKSNLKLLRRVLAENGGKNDILLVVTGPLITLYELYRSGPDEISPKTGLELAKENIERIIIAAGNFQSFDVREWNIRCDAESALAVLNHSPIPILYSGNEVGGCIISGQSLADQPEDYPLRDCYYELNNAYQTNECTRNSWDLVVAYYAVYGDTGLWGRQDGYEVEVDEQGRTRFAPGGIHSYLVPDYSKTDEICAIFNEQMAVDNRK